MPSSPMHGRSGGKAREAGEVSHRRTVRAAATKSKEICMVGGRGALAFCPCSARVTQDYLRSTPNYLEIKPTIQE